MIRFTKMHGLGNDFMVVDCVRQDVNLSESKIRELADRRTGVGFDQLLLIEPPTDDNCDFFYRIYNADGGEVEHCGNGARCVARFARDQGLTNADHLRFQLLQSTMDTEILDDGQVRVDMGIPVLEPKQIPYRASKRNPTYQLLIPQIGQSVDFSALSMGNPHAVLLVDDIDSAPVATLGPLIEAHPDFPNRVNVGFMQVMSPDQVRLRVFERGVGETRACGTGACAAVAAGQIQGLLHDTVTVELIGGKLSIQWEGEGKPLFMTGPATTVYNGTLSV